MSLRRSLPLLVLCLASPAFAGGPFTPNATQPPVALTFEQPTNCQNCHGFDYDESAVLEPHDSWKGSMMANSARDPLFWAALDVANEDVPGVGDFCLRCHVPQGWYEGRSEPPASCADGSCLDGSVDQAGNDFEGVSCHLCHRVMENPSPPMGEEGFYTENGQVWIDDTECPDSGAGEPCRRGPYDYVGNGDEPPHVWAFSPLHTESRFCGACHNVTNPVKTLIDESGTDTGIPYPIERTYTEWTVSDFADTEGADFATCQDCHMPQADGSPIYACAFPQVNDRTGDLAVHEFVGGNAWIPQVLKGEYGSPGQLDREAAYDWTTARALDMLRNQSAQLELLSLAEAPDGDGNLAATIRVTNLSGHKLPTGYTEGRRMWLHVEARDGQDQVFWESGAYDDVTGELTHDAQLRIYHSERGIWNLNGTDECDVTDDDMGGAHVFHFVLNDCILDDTRIPPKGFTPAGDVEILPVGATYPEVEPGVLQHWDDVDYAIPVPPEVAGPVEVTVTLYYQTASREYVEYLRDESLDDNAEEDPFPDDPTPGSGADPGETRGEYLYRLWTEYGQAAPVDMKTAQGQTLDWTIFADGFESGDTTAW